MPITKATPEDEGCYVDGHWGQYATAHMIEVAEEFGYGSAVHFNLDSAERDELNAQQAITHLASRKLSSMMPEPSDSLTDEEEEELYEASDSVESWLNEHVAPEGYFFGWHDGEFFLSPVEDES